jgi:hypothetical protein
VRCWPGVLRLQIRDGLITYGRVCPKSGEKQILEKFCVIMLLTRGVGCEKKVILVIKILEKRFQASI